MTYSILLLSIRRSSCVALWKVSSLFPCERFFSISWNQITNDLLMAADKGLISVLVLLDLSAAFDTIDHCILLQRLDQSIGISGTALSWFKSYLSDRSQFIFVNDDASITTNVSHRVLQGSVLGPIIFTLYMLPLGNFIRKHSINLHCYADDT